VTNSGAITSTASSSGNAGTIKIGNEQQRMSELTVNPGENSKISTTASGTGASGTIDLYADKVTVNGGKIQSQATGPGNSSNSPANISFHQANDLTIKNDLTINQGGEVSSSTSGASPAGTITVNASTVNLSNGKITSDAEATATGRAGAIVMGDQRRVSDLNVGTGSTISTTAKGTSASGKIDIYADKVTVKGGKIQSQATGPGDLNNPPANIKLHEVKELKIENIENIENTEGEISSSTAGNTIAGDVTVTASTTSSSPTTVDISQGKISSNATGGSDDTKPGGKAGEIKVGEDKQRFDSVTLKEGGKIETNAWFSNSGVIGVYAKDLEITGNQSSINAVNTGGNKGDPKPADITVNATNSLKIKDGGRTMNTIKIMRVT